MRCTSSSSGRPTAAAWPIRMPTCASKPVSWSSSTKFTGAPDVFGLLRGIIDERRRAGDRAGHFLLLGSASLDLMKQASETLAGRGAYWPIDKGVTTIDLAGLMRRL
jgi:hypothetical protein